MLDDLLLTPKSQKIFRKTECNGELYICIQKKRNKRGSFPGITKIQSWGEKLLFGQGEHPGGSIKQDAVNDSE